MEKMILLDASFLIACAEFKIDYLSEFDRIFSSKFTLIVIDKVFEELSRLAEEGNLKKKSTARLAKTIVERKNIQILKTDGKNNADDTIVNVSNKNSVVATIDAELKRRLKLKSIPVLVIRQKKYVQMLQN